MAQLLCRSYSVLYTFTFMTGSLNKLPEVTIRSPRVMESYFSTKQ